MNDKELFDMVNRHSDDTKQKEVFRMVNNHSDSVTQKNKDAYQNSKSAKKIAYGQKKKKNKLQLKVAITSVVLAATIAISSGMAISNAINDPRKNIDQRITEYTELMDMYANKDNSIETYLGRLDITGVNEAKVNYTQENVDNLSRHLKEAAQKSETETRCAIIAAFKIINEPYRDQIIGEALEQASATQEENSNYKIPSTTKDFLETLGYQDWKEYQENERENIKDLYMQESNKEAKSR